MGPITQSCLCDDNYQGISEELLRKRYLNSDANEIIKPVFWRDTCAASEHQYISNTVACVGVDMDIAHTYIHSNKSPVFKIFYLYTVYRTFCSEYFYVALFLFTFEIHGFFVYR